MEDTMLQAIYAVVINTQNDVIAIKNDIKRLDEKIDAVEARLNAKIDSVESKLNDKIDTTKKELINLIDSKISSKTEIICNEFVRISDIYCDEFEKEQKKNDKRFKVLEGFHKNEKIFLEQKKNTKCRA